jgi:diguanylate cyclase (GGDEF)-like protein
MDRVGLARISLEPGPVRDRAWLAEVDREVLRAIVGAERQALGANLLCLIVIGAAAATLPNWPAYHLPIAVRIVAIVVKRFAMNRLQARLELPGDPQAELRNAALTLVLAGASWALLLVPVIITPFVNPGRLLVGSGVLIGVSIIAVLLTPVRRLAMPFTLGFILTLAIGLLWAPPAFTVKVGLGLVAIFVIFFSFGLATRPRHRAAAAALVENRRLTENLATALTKAEFLAHHDPLTGLLNRRALFENELNGSDPGRYRHIVVVDLDHFKAINDRYGHDMGDLVLVATASQLRAVIEEVPGTGHSVVRMGGEEFVMLLNISDVSLTRTIAEMARHAIAQVTMELNQPDLRVTASIGFVGLGPGQSLDCALNAADRAMYRAKGSGRNRVVRGRTAMRTDGSSLQHLPSPPRTAEASR